MEKFISLQFQTKRKTEIEKLAVSADLNDQPLQLHSDRSASTGRDAKLWKPDTFRKTSDVSATIKALKTEPKLHGGGSGVTIATSFAATIPIRTPMAAAITAMVEDSIRNCKRMSLRRAPRLWRTPISRYVR